MPPTEQIETSAHSTRKRILAITTLAALAVGGFAVAKGGSPDVAEASTATASATDAGTTPRGETHRKHDRTGRHTKHGHRHGDRASRNHDRDQGGPVGSDTAPPAGTPTTDPAPNTDPTPTPTPTPTPDPTPTPAPAPAPGGFPDAASTGTTGSLTRHDGNMTVSKDGAVVKDLDIRGELRITGDNVKVQNVRVQTNGFWVVLVQSSGVTIENSTFIGGDNSQAALAGRFVGRNLDLSGAGDGIKMHEGGELHDSYIHDLSHGEGVHNDGIEAGGAVKIVHNTILNDRSQTSSIMLSEYGSDPDTNVLIQDNLLGGAGYTIYGGAPDTAKGHEVIGNRFTTRYFPNSGYYGPLAYWSKAGNTWSDNRWIDGPKKGELITP